MTYFWAVPVTLFIIPLFFIWLADTFEFPGEHYNLSAVAIGLFLMVTCWSAALMSIFLIYLL